MLYTLYYQKRNGDTVVITRSKSLLKLLKIKLVTYGFDTRAFIAVGREQFDKLDLSYDERTQYNDYRQCAWKIVLKHYNKGGLNHDRKRNDGGISFQL